MLSKPLERFPLLMRFLVFAICMLCGGYYLSTLLLSSTLPPARMQLFPPGSLSPAFIARDTHGVPFIHARTDDDAFFAIGYAHAQDRLWQLEVQRRTIHGQLSELFGESSLQRDMWFKLLDLPASAETAWPMLDDAAKRSLQKYVEGINAGIDAQSKLPLEFRLHRIRPQHWTHIDSLARLKHFALSSSGDFQVDLTREFARRALTTQQLHTIFPDPELAGLAERPKDPGLIEPRSAHGRDIEIETLPWTLASRGRSNAWAVAGSHAEGGAALLASDASHELQIPSAWYMIHAKGKQLAVSGMTLVGLPLVIFGRNDGISWAGASVAADTQDVYFENTETDRPTHYEVSPGHFEKFQTRDVEIKVRVTSDISFMRRQQRSVTIQRRATVNGPVISDQLGGFDHPISLRWVGFDAGDTSYEALYRLQFASNWETFRDALSRHVTPALQMIYADTDGNIGSVTSGKLPIRKRGTGTLPAPGWDSSFGWSGYIQTDQLPTLFNPPEGFIVASNGTASRTPVSDSRDAGTSPPVYVTRIGRLLAKSIDQNGKVTLSDMQRIQGDVIDTDAADLASELVKIRADNDRAREALSLLRGWNGDMSADSAAAVVLHVWAQRLRKQFLDTTIQWYRNRPEQQAYLRAMELQMDMRALRRAVTQCGSTWSTFSTGEGPFHGCEEILRSTLQAALQDIERITGSDDPTEWTWASIHLRAYEHVPFSARRPVDGLFGRHASVGGSPNTVNAAESVFVRNVGFVQRLGTNVRQVLRVGKTDIAHRFMISTGQSGNIASAQYDDMVGPFARVEYYR